LKNKIAGEGFSRDIAGVWYEYYSEYLFGSHFFDSINRLFAI